MDKLTEASLTQFFFIARTYLLNNSIPWDSFSDYFLAPNILGPEIFSKVANALIGYPTHKETLKNLSCFIERIIFRLLPVQETYYDAEVRILDKHKQHLTGPNPSIDYTRTYIHSDAQDLTTKSPYYKQHNDITDEQLRMMIDVEKTNLLHKIITHTSYDAKIHKLLIASAKYKEINQVPNAELLDNIQSLMVAEEKTAIALVNATKLASHMSSPRTPRRSRNQNSTSGSAKPRTRSESRGSTGRLNRRTTPNRATSRSPQPRGTRQSRQSSNTPERGRRGSKPQLQERCDTCLKLNLSQDFCHGNRHCRRDGHQPDYRKSSELERRVQRNDPDTFVIYDNCNKCFPPKPKTAKWLHGNTSSQVLIPPNYFGRPPPNYVQYVNTDAPPMGSWHYPQQWHQQPPQEYQQFQYNQQQSNTQNGPPTRRNSPNQRHPRPRSPYNGPQDHQDRRQR